MGTTAALELYDAPDRCAGTVVGICSLVAEEGQSSDILERGRDSVLDSALALRCVVDCGFDTLASQVVLAKEALCVSVRCGEQILACVPPSSDSGSDLAA